jgi:hypothetical protein
MSKEGTTARLILLEDDPYLCILDVNSPAGQLMREYTASNNRFLPLGLIVMDDDHSPCTLEHKVYTAASLGVSFLVVVTSSHLFPRRLLVSSDSTAAANLTILSITSECRDGLFDAAPAENWGDDSLLGWEAVALGHHDHVKVVMDPIPFTSQDFLLIPLALSFVVVVCVFFPARRVVEFLVVPVPACAPRLLTEDFVLGLCCSPGATREIVEHSGDPPICAICLDHFDLSSKITVLPCGHPFDQDCILEWLTKRQPLCPICKRDLTCTNGRDEARSRFFESGSSTIESPISNPPSAQSGNVVYLPTFGPSFRLIASSQMGTASPELAELDHDLELSTVQ